MSNSTDREIEHQMRWLKIKSAFLGVAFTILIISTAVLAYWLLTGKDAVVVKGDVTVKPSVVQPGSTAAMNISFCKVTSAEGRIVRRLVSNTSELLIPTANDSSGKRCYDNAPVPIPIPAQTSCGTYHVNYHVVYQTNPLHSVTEDINSKPFKVCS